MALDFGEDERDCAKCDSDSEPDCWKANADGVLAGDGGLRVERELEFRIAEKGGGKLGPVDEVVWAVENEVKPRR